MRKKMKLAAIALTILTFHCQSADVSNKPVTSNLNEYFEYESVVELDTSVFVSIKHLDVNNQGYLLVTNSNRTDVFLFDSAGSYIRSLGESAEESFPGINWSPLRAYFSNNDSIFVANNYPWGIHFDPDGAFSRNMPKSYEASMDVAFSNKNEIFAFVSNRSGIRVDKYTSVGEKITSFANYPDDFKNVIDKSVVGNNMVVIGNHLFHKNIAETRIYKYDLSGKLLDTFNEVPTYYKSPKNDIRIEPKNVLMKDMMEFAKKYTANYSIHALNNQTLLIQYLNMGYNYGIQLINLEGEYVLDKDMMTNTKVLAARDNRVYMVNPADVELNRIFVYKYINE